MIGNSPCRRGGVSDETWNQVKMQVLSPLAKGNGINAIALCEPLHKTTGLLNSTTPTRCFLIREIDRTGTMAQSVQYQPTRQRRWIGMVPQHPQFTPLNFLAIALHHVLVNRTDRTVL